MSSASARTYDIAIIGAGIFGTAMASTMGKQGRTVLLLERDLSEPDRIVGELLQPGGVQALEKLGLRDCLEKIDAIPVYGYEVIYHGKPVHIPYPVNGRGKAPQGRSFHHGKFIMRLREAARNSANVTVVEATVKDLVKNEVTGQVLGVVCRRKGEKEDEHYFASLTISADGYASNFRKHLHKSHKPYSTSTFVGLELKDCVLPRPNHGHVVIGSNPPVLLYQIGAHDTRALIDIRKDSKSIIASGEKFILKDYLTNVVLPDLPECIRPSFSHTLKTASRFPSMPNSFLPPTTNIIPGFLVLGDAMNMRHPLTGGGMTVAFKDVVLLKSLLSPQVIPDLDDVDAVLYQMSTFHWSRKNGTSVINILSMALYSLFAACDDPLLTFLQRGCFVYFEKGGDCVDGPVGLLAGIINQPLILFWHFYRVAFLSIWLLWSGDDVALRVWNWPWAVYMTVRIFARACAVIWPFIYSEMRS